MKIVGMTFRVLGLFVCVVMGSSGALAETKDNGESTGEQNSFYFFNDDLEGELEFDVGECFPLPNSEAKTPLLKIREDFIVEIIITAAVLR